tara:strand:- start:15337 stop:18441 length:3105 start_codon:yes stop_codon:yes gene_type:complete
MFNLKKKLNHGRAILEIKKFGLDWTTFFAVNAINSKRSPIDFFVRNVNNTPLIVPDVLDVDYYLRTYPDIDKNTINPLIHYLRYGKKENRRAFPSKRDIIPQICAAQIKHDFYVIQQQGINWSSYVTDYSLSSEDEAIAHYCTYWPTILPVIKDVIDTVYYVEQYSDIWELGDNPLVHYITHGKHEGRKAFEAASITLAKIENPEEEVFQVSNNAPVCEFERKLRQLKVQSDKFNIYNNCNLENNEIIQYILDNHNKMKLNIPGIFDSELYLELYPDIAKAKVSPLFHYMTYGKSEGRIGYFNLKKHFRLGAYSFDAKKALYVIVCHESSATGAPLVGFNLAQQLSKKYNVVNFVLKEEKLHSAFEQESIATFSNMHVQSSVLAKKALKHLVNQFKDVDGIICNSVETAYVLQAANELNIPSISLVHEFSEYTRPVGKITNTVFHADRVIVPAGVVKDSICRELKSYRAIKVIPNNIVVQPQGRLPYIPKGHGKLDCTNTLLNKIGISDKSDAHVLVGAGYVQIRKGVDLFISVAKRIKDLTNKPCKFVWVGEGYNPSTDLNYANWVQTQITLNGLEDDVVFLGHQRNLDNVMSLTDVFCMTSRLDPFPNVVIDALDADVHVACFDKSTGCADFLKDNQANATIVDYLNIEQFAEGVSEYLNTQERYKGINHAIVKQSLSFDNYVNVVLEELNNASDLRKKIAESISVISAENCFNANFYDPNISEEQALKEYVQLGMKGIHLYNPKPGFNERTWLALNESNNPYKVGLFEALNKNLDTETHTVLLANDLKNDNAEVNFKFAVHLHLFYVDLAKEFSEYFSYLPVGFDLFITYVDDTKAEYIAKTFNRCGANNVELELVANIGRDVAPFFDTIKEKCSSGNYEVIGHFHSKKSYEISEEMGDSWRSFLMNTLIGSREHVYQVLSQFNKHDTGLIFADDRHCVDEGENKQYIEQLCTDMEITPPAHTSLFPLGTMFWARKKALKPLFELDFKKYIQPEPLPNDGSYMHSIERILPVVVASNSYSIKTITKDSTNW